MTREATPDRRRGRPITGSPKKGDDGLWRVRVPIPGTSRTRAVKLGPEIQTIERASEVARHWYEKLVEDPSLLGEGPAPEKLTNGQYLERWTNERKGRVRTAVPTRNELLLHVLDDATLRNKVASKTTRDDVRRMVARLNDKVEAGQMAASSARKVWRKARCMFHDMFAHEKDELRNREDDPTAGIKPPRDGSTRKTTFLYPNEAVKLFECEDVPLRSRRFWCLLMYTGMRFNELRALDWSAVDLERGKISVHEALDRDAEDDADDTKETKTGEMREIDILPALLPLLEAMHEEAGGKGRLTWGHAQPSMRFRAHIARADLKRPALTADDKARRPIRAQDLRGTCATWIGLGEQLSDTRQRDVFGRRVGPLYARDMLGHADYQTTQRHYERASGERTEHVGEPFPTLPAALFVSADQSTEGPIPASNTCEIAPAIAKPAEITPRPLRSRRTRRIRSLRRRGCRSACTRA
jgi:integrase